MMKRISLLVILVGVCSAYAVAGSFLQKKETTPVSAEAQATYQDIESTLGLVPKFFALYPEAGIEGAWSEFKSLHLNGNTAISQKNKELIGLAISAQIPCSYCTYFHTAFAKFYGATEQEVREAVAVASGTRHWSAVLNGAQLSEGRFKSEVKRMLKYLEDNKDKPVQTQPAQSTYQDIENTLGLVPEFLKWFPEVGIEGAWKDMKGVLMSSTTAISPKVKELIGIAVSAQIPCTYCSYYHTEVAKFHGASKQEVRQAVASASIVSRWSTVLNGLRVKEKKFKNEVKEILKFARAKQKNN